jgi:hypothetical protein
MLRRAASWQRRETRKKAANSRVRFSSSFGAIFLSFAFSNTTKIREIPKIENDKRHYSALIALLEFFQLIPFCFCLMKRHWGRPLMLSSRASRTELFLVSISVYIIARKLLGRCQSDETKGALAGASSAVDRKLFWRVEQMKPGDTLAFFGPCLLPEQ